MTAVTMTIAGESADDFLDAVLRTPPETAFLFGAGASMPAPTRIPTVFTFYDRLMQIADIRTEIKNVLWEKIRTIRPQPRFEVFVHQFQEIDVSLQFAEIFNVKSFNSIHSFISRAINGGAIGITTNFDECVELSGLGDGLVVAYNGEDLPTSQKCSALYKPHGTISLNKQHLVVTDEALSRTNNGFELLPNWRNTLLDAIGGKTLIVIGYSGSDDFDITPILEVSNPQCIVWIRHDANRVVFDQLSGVSDRIKQALEHKNVIAITGDFEDYIHRRLGTWRSATENEIVLDDILNSIIDSAEKKVAVERLFLKHFCCYAELLDAAAHQPIRINAKDYAYALFKLSRYKDCIEYGQTIRPDDLASAEDWHLINYYVTSSLIMNGRYAEASSRIQLEELNQAKIPNFRLRCEWRNLYASAKYITGDWDAAKTQYAIALDDARNHGYLEGFATASWGIGDVFAVERDYDKSLSYYFEAAATAEALGKNAHCVTINRNIAEVHIDTGQYSEARKYLNRANAIWPTVDQRYNNFYLLFTELKLALIEQHEDEFANICNQLLILVADGIATAILVELLVLIIVAHFDRDYSLDRSRYFDFLAVAIERVDNSHFLKTLGNPRLVDLIFAPRLNEEISDELVSSLRSIVFHSSKYLDLCPTTRN